MVLILFIGLLGAQPVIELGPDTLVVKALQAFERGPGKAYAIEAEGLREAWDATGPRLERVDLIVDPEIDARTGDRGEHNLGLKASISLANLPHLRRSVLEAERKKALQTRAKEQLAFILQVQDAYGKAFLAHVLLHHVKALEQEALRQERDLKTLVEKQLIGKLQLYALRTHRGQYAHEAGKWERQLWKHGAELERLLGGKVSLTFPKLELSQAVINYNPFTDLLETTQKPPDVLLAQAEAQTAFHKASLTRGLNAPVLSPGINYRNEPGGDQWLGVGVGLSFSLRPRKGSEWRKQQSRARAWEATVQWRDASQKAILEQRFQLYENNKLHALSFKEDVLEPLQMQADLYRRALEKGHVERRFHLEAEAALHEAEHDYLVMVHGLWSEQAEAAVLQQSMAGGFQ